MLVTATGMTHRGHCWQREEEEEEEEEREKWREGSMTSASRLLRLLTCVHVAMPV